MARFVVRRKSSGTTEGAPLVGAMSRLVSSDYRAFARVKLESSSFARLSDISSESDSSQKLRKRKTLIVDGEQRAMQRLSEEASQQDYFVEPLIEYSKAEVTFDMFRAAPLDLAKILRTEPLSVSAVGAERKLNIQVQGRGAQHYEDLAYAQVHIFLAASGRARGRLQMQTNENGVAEVSIASWYSVLAIVAYPYSGYAPVVHRGDQRRKNVRLLCDRLPRAGAGSTAWWHDTVGVSGGTENRSAESESRAIRVGVIDSGCGPHPCLKHVKNLGRSLTDVLTYPGGWAKILVHMERMCAGRSERGWPEGMAFPLEGFPRWSNFIRHGFFLLIQMPTKETLRMRLMEWSPPVSNW